MKLKLIALTVTTFVVAGSVFAIPVNARTGSSSDKITLDFRSFQDNTVIKASYTNNNGVNITGPATINPTHSAVIAIESTNSHNGNPSIKLTYITEIGKSEDCTLTFIDGPSTQLAYSSKVGCQSITVGRIVQTGQNIYEISILDRHIG